MTFVSRPLIFVFSLYLITLQTSMSGMEISTALLVLFFLLTQGKNTVALLRDFPLLKPILCFSIIVVVGICLGPASTHDKLKDLARLRFFLWVFIVWALLRPLFPTRKWLFPMAFTSFIVGIYSFFQHFYSFDFLRPEGKKVLMFAVPEGKIGPLVVGFFNHHLTFANIFLFYACLYFALRRHYRFLGSLGGFFFLLVAWTQSRMAWVAILVSAFFFLLGKNLKTWVIGGALGLLVVGGFFFTDSGFRGRLDQVLHKKDTTESVQDRLKLWEIQWEIFKEYPVFGMGWNNNERFAKTYYSKLFPNVEKPFYGHAHSEILQVLSTTGLLGLIAYLWIWGVLFFNLWRKRKKALPNSFEYDLASGLLIAFVGFHIQGLTQWNFGDAEVLHNVMFFWALALND